MIVYVHVVERRASSLTHRNDGIDIIKDIFKKLATFRVVTTLPKYVLDSGLYSITCIRNGLKIALWGSIF